jgi:hypothetical protein
MGKLRTSRWYGPLVMAASWGAEERKKGTRGGPRLRSVMEGVGAAATVAGVGASVLARRRNQ